MDLTAQVIQMIEPELCMLNGRVEYWVLCGCGLNGFEFMKIISITVKKNPAFCFDQRAPVFR